MTQPNIQDVSYPVLIEFGHVMADAGWFTESRDVLYFLEKPDKYKNEFQTWNECGLPKMGDPNWYMFTDAIDYKIEDDNA